jgi:hypothetical protein
MPKAQVAADELQTLIVQEVRRHEHCGQFGSVNPVASSDAPETNWGIGGHRSRRRLSRKLRRGNWSDPASDAAGL